MVVRQVFRQRDESFIAVLNELRVGEPSDATLKLLQSGALAGRSGGGGGGQGAGGSGGWGGGGGGGGGGGAGGGEHASSGADDTAGIIPTRLFSRNNGALGKRSSRGSHP